MQLISVRAYPSFYSIKGLGGVLPLDAGASKVTSQAVAGTQLLLGGKTQVGLSVLLKDTLEEQIMVTQPSIESMASRTGVWHPCHYTTTLADFAQGIQNGLASLQSALG